LSPPEARAFRNGLNALFTLGVNFDSWLSSSYYFSSFIWAFGAWAVTGVTSRYGVTGRPWL